MNLLPANLAKLADIASRDDRGRWTLRGVHVERSPEGTFTAAATDTRMLLRVSGPCEPADEFPSIPAMKDVPDDAASGIVPASVWGSVFAAATKHSRKATKSILQNVAVAIGREQAVFGMTNGDSSPVETTKLMEGRFPPVDDVFPKKPAAMRIRINPLLMAKLLKAMAEIAPPDLDGNDGVTMEIWDPNRPMVFRCPGPRGQELSGLLMPITTEAAKASDEESDAVVADKPVDDLRERELTDALRRRNDEIEELLAERSRLLKSIAILQANARELACERDALQAAVDQAGSGVTPKVDRLLTRAERLALKSMSH